MSLTRPPSRARSRASLGYHFCLLRSALSVLHRQAILRHQDIAMLGQRKKDYNRVVQELRELNGEEILQVAEYLRELQPGELKQRLESDEEFYSMAKPGRKGYPLAKIRHTRSLLRFLLLGDDGSRRAKVLLARRILDPLKIPRGNPKNLIRVTKEGQRLPTHSEQYVKVTGLGWCQLTRRPKPSSWPKVYEGLPLDHSSGGRLINFYEEEIEDVSNCHPWEREVEEALFDPTRDKEWFSGIDLGAAAT